MVIQPYISIVTIVPRKCFIQVIQLLAILPCKSGSIANYSTQYSLPPVAIHQVKTSYIASHCSALKAKQSRMIVNMANCAVKSITGIQLDVSGQIVIIVYIVQPNNQSSCSYIYCLTTMNIRLYIQICLAIQPSTILPCSVYLDIQPLVVKTFKNSTAERVPSECSQLRYTSDILEYLLKSTAERVPSECSQVRYTCDIFLWIHKAFCCHASRIDVDCGMIAGYYFEV